MLGTQLFCTTLWKLWFARNQFLFKSIAVDPIRINADVLSFVSEYVAANPLHNSICGDKSGNLNIGGSLENNYIYVDAGCYREGGTGWGVVFTSEDNSITYSACRREEFVVNPVMAEALGMRWTLGLAAELGISNATIPTVVSYINQRTTIADLDPVISDCRTYLNRDVNLNVIHVNRCNNAAAHDLASLARRCGTRSWIGFPNTNVFDFYNATPTFSGNFPLV